MKSLECRASVIADLGLGDGGKGTTTDFLARYLGAKAVVRYNGGPQAAHNVIDPDGRQHCFAQFGSGTLVPGTKTLLSREMLIEPESLMVEEEFLQRTGVTDALERLTIDAECALVTPAHILVCRLAEMARGDWIHGSCGLGVGQAIFDREKGLALTVGDVLESGPVAVRKLRQIIATKLNMAQALLGNDPTREMRVTHAHFLECCSVNELLGRYRRILTTPGISVDGLGGHLAHLLDRGGAIIFEGAQGALLDRQHGFTPYVTKSRTTHHNATAFLEEALRKAESGLRLQSEKVGVLRSYGHRHGAGPFVTEDPVLMRALDDPLNPENRWQGKFRVGWFDLPAIRYGLLLNGGVDWMALTNLDRLSGLEVVRVCTSYDYEGDLRPLDRYFEWDRLGERRARIQSFKAPDASDRPQGELAELLFRCRSSGWVEFPGWSEDISGVRRFEGLPYQAREYVDFLQSFEGLSIPINLISVSPKADGKFFIH